MADSRRNGLIARRFLFGIVVLAAGLQAQGIARTWLPAQDGLKYIQAARAFHDQSWLDAIRGTDQHPLYAMMIALAQPAVAALGIEGPDSWRVAAQVVSTAAYLLVLVPLFALTRHLFGVRAGCLAALLWVALPLPAEIGHDTFSDSLGLLWFTLAFWQGERWLSTGRPLHATCAGVAAGLGFWTRPELAVVGLVLIALSIARLIANQVHTQRFSQSEMVSATLAAWRGPVAAAGVSLSFLGMVGLYTVAKGEVSEKLTVRLGLGLPPSAAPRPITSRPDFELAGLPPKEESRSAQTRPTLGWAIQETASLWLRTLGFVLAPLALVGAVRAPASSARLLAKTYLLVFVGVLLRHATSRGYLSHRHVLTLTIVCLPWASWRYLCLINRLGDWIQVPQRYRRGLTALCVATLLFPGVVAQCKPIHPSRMGHWAAGQWLAHTAEEPGAVLDTRGWAGFLSGRTAYDPWHLRQAFSDQNLRFVVIEQRELEADTVRGHRLASWIETHGQLVTRFPSQPDGIADTVLVYRYQTPASKEAPQ